MNQIGLISGAIYFITLSISAKLDERWSGFGGCGTNLLKFTTLRLKNYIHEKIKMLYHIVNFIDLEPT